MNIPVNKKFILPVVVVSQFLCTSLWFAGNAILPELRIEFSLPERTLGDLTSAVQFGFIAGTLVFALLSVADRFSPSKVFFGCALVGSGLNLSIIAADGIVSLMVLRALAGFCLAGIYPVGMKIASDYHEKGLGKALGYLVGALVIGTAFPHLLRTFFPSSIPWKEFMAYISGFVLLGGISILIFVPDGPYRKAGSKVDLRQCFYVFREKSFRAAAFGYFGHMWELYTFWAFVPVLLRLFAEANHGFAFHTSLWSFIIIAIGGLACVVGGYLAEKWGSKRVAFFSLLASGLCCVISIFSFQFSPVAFLIFLVVWGLTVIPDSPQFSTLVAKSAPQEATGTSLTIVNSIGFALTIISLQVMNILITGLHPHYVFATLAVGPLIGLIALSKHH